MGHFSLTLGEERERGSGEPLSGVQSSSNASGGMDSAQAANKQGLRYWTDQLFNTGLERG